MSVALWRKWRDGGGDASTGWLMVVLVMQRGGEAVVVHEKRGNGSVVIRVTRDAKAVEVVVMIVMRGMVMCMKR